MYRPGAWLGESCSENEVGLIVQHRAGDVDQLAWIQRGIGVHEAHDIAIGRAQPGEAR